MFKDPYRESIDSPMSPSEACFPIIPGDDVDLPRATKAIYVGRAGDITLRSVRGDVDVTFRNLSAGTILDVRVRAVRASGTSAGDLVGLA